MILTNKYGYNETVVRAIRNDSYSRGDSEFSATGLIQPARIRVLSLRHEHEIEVDVDDEVFKLFGHLGHSILDRAGDALNAVTEKRFFGTIEGTKISAQIDSLSLVNDKLTDWKFTTVFGFKKGTPPKPEWCNQLNIQLELLRMNGMDAKDLEIVGLLRDWRPAEASRDPNYPTKIASHKIPMAPREHTQTYIKKRIKAHREAEVTLPDCTVEEHWHWRRCQGYCQVSKYCTQFQQHQKKESIL